MMPKSVNPGFPEIKPATRSVVEATNAPTRSHLFLVKSSAFLEPAEGPPWRPIRLLYPVFTRSTFVEMRLQLEAIGEDTSGFDRFEKGGLGWPDDEVDIVLDVSATMEEKWKALHCHRTQFGPSNPFRQLPEEVIRSMLGREHFILAWPKASKRPPADLFDGL